MGAPLRLERARQGYRASHGCGIQFDSQARGDASDEFRGAVPHIVRGESREAPAVILYAFPARDVATELLLIGSVVVALVLRADLLGPPEEVRHSEEAPAWGVDRRVQFWFRKSGCDDNQSGVRFLPRPNLRAHLRERFEKSTRARSAPPRLSRPLQ